MTRSPALIQLFILLALLLYLVGLGAQAQTPPLVFIPSPPSAPPPVTFHPSPVVGTQGTTGTQGTIGTGGAGTGGAGTQGVQGVQGVTGAQGVQGIQGVPGTSASGVSGIVSTAPGTGLTAAKGDGAANDTAALQAEIQYCQDHDLPLLLAPGVYKITAPLHVCIPSPIAGEANYQMSGFRIKGLGNSAINGYAGVNGIFAYLGATILMAGQSQKAIIQIDGGVCYYNAISDVTLDGGSASLGTTYALWAPWQKWSGLRLDNVITKNTDTAVAVTGAAAIGLSYGGSGGNGEQLDCYSCHFNARTKIYLNSSDSGQAYLHHFFACTLTTSQAGGATLFEIGGGGQGCQCDFYGTSATMTPGTAPNVFFQDDGTTDPINWWGGRAEQVDTLVKWNGGSAAVQGHVNIQGMAFPVTTGKGPLFDGSGNSCQYFFTIRSCYFTAAGTPVAALGFNYAGNSAERIKLEECDFTGWTSYTAITGSSKVTLNDCRYFGTDSIAHPLVHL